MKKLAAASLVALTVGHAHAGPTTYSATGRVLALDGSSVGPVVSFSGGNEIADVITMANSATQMQQKHLGNVKYEDITINASASMDPGFYGWIRSTLNAEGTRRNGSMSQVSNGKEMERRTFTNALVTEVTFPKLDGGSKDAAALTLKFKPEQVKVEFPNTAASAPAAARAWTGSHFKVVIDGIDASQASHVDAISTKQIVVVQPTGETRAPATGGKISITGLAVVLPAAQLAPLQTWIKASAPKNGSIEYQDDAGKPIFTLSFAGLKPTNVGAVNGAARVELSADKMTIN